MDPPHHHHDDYNPPRTVEAIFMDYKARRAGIIRALTTDVNKFYNQCDPEKDILGLYGLPNRRWEVVQPTEDVPPAVPEPILGINFAKDSMPKNDWISLVAIHSDSWLMSVAYFYLGRFGFDRADRTRFFNWINELPTVFEVVNGVESYKKPANGRGGISKSDSKIKSEGRQLKPPKDEDEIPNGQDEDGGNEDASCGTWKTGKDDF